MGGLFSKLQVYFQTKVDNAKQAVYGKIDRTKQAIRQRIDDTRTAIVNRIIDTRNSITTKINNVKTAVFTRVINFATAVVTGVRTSRDELVRTVVNTKNHICNRIRAVRDRICSTVTAARIFVVSCILAVVTAVVNAKNATVAQITAFKNAVVSRYQNTKNAIRSRYHSIRNAKLTRWQKFKYGSCAAVLLFVIAVIALTLLDVYLGDTESAKRRLDNIWWSISTASQALWDVTLIGGSYALQGSKIAVENVCYWLEIAFRYGLIGVQIAGRHAYAGGLVAAEYAAAGTRVAAHHAYEGALTCGHYAWIGGKQGAVWAYDASAILLDYGSYGAVTTWQHLKAATVSGSYYAAEGCKLGASYAALGADYALRHGSVALKDGLVWLYHYTIYFVTNFREASVEAAQWSWAAANTAAETLSAASYTAGIWTGRALSEFLDKSCEFSVAAFHWLCAASSATADWTAVAVTTGAETGVAAAGRTLNFIGTTFVSAYEAVVAFAVGVYTGTVTVVEWTVTTACLVWDWSTAFATKTGQLLYVGLTEYGFHWTVAIGNGLVQVACFFGRVLGKFFGDLGVYVANFLYVTSTRIASVVYIVLLFVYRMLTAVASVIKAFTGAAVFCTTRVFSVVIWFLRETLFAYMFMLHQYNMYRELLFLLFVGLLSVYCTGLMRDRRRLVEEDEPDGSDDEEEEEEEREDGGDDASDAAKRPTADAPKAGTKQAISVKDLAPTIGACEMPSHDEVDTHDDTLTEFAIHEHGADDDEEHELREEDLVPDQTIPESEE